MSVRVTQTRLSFDFSLRVGPALKNVIILILSSVLITAASASLGASSLGSTLDFWLLDSWFRLRGERTAPENIAIVGMDEHSYSALGVNLSSAWPRALHAELLQRLKHYGAERVVFDILFYDQGPDPLADQKLAQSIADIPTVLGAEIQAQQMAAAGGSFTLQSLLEPYEPFRKAALSLGLAQVPAQDGYARHFPNNPHKRIQDVPMLANAALASSSSAPRAQPADWDLLNYYGPAFSISTISYALVVDPESKLPANALRGKTIFVGLQLRTALGPAQKDVFNSPFGGEAMYGVEVHATAAANLQEGSWIRRQSPSWEAVTEAGFTLLSTLALCALTPLKALLLASVLVLGWGALSFWLFCSGFFLAGVVPVLLVLPLVLLGSTAYYYWVTRAAEQKMRSAFELYLSPDMARSLSGKGQRVTLGGEKLWATAVFTDIAGFTQITEEMPAEKVAAMLNDYFSEVMEVVFQNKGTLIKFIGDAVFLLWGAPVRIDNHAELAVKTAQRIRAEVTRFNDSGRFPRLETRIGIHTGPMVVGNLGSRKRFDYTAIGDAVNLASRIEGINKYLGTALLFSEATRKDAGNSISAINMGCVRVAGKRELVRLYTTLDQALSPEDERLWNQALESFAQREWQQAKASFTQASQSIPALTGPARAYLDAISVFERTAPAASWQGELVFEGK